MIPLPRELAGQSPLRFLGISVGDIGLRGGGKSGLHRAECQVIPGGREPTESATENKPPVFTFVKAGKGEMVR